MSTPTQYDEGVVSCIVCHATFRHRPRDPECGRCLMNEDHAEALRKRAEHRKLMRLDEPRTGPPPALFGEILSLAKPLGAAR